MATYYLTFVGLGIITTALGPALPFLAERTGVSIEVASGMFSAKSLGFMAGSFVVGRYLEKIRPHGLLLTGLLLCGAVVVAIPLTPEFGLLLAILFAAGVFVGTADVGANILIVWQMKERVAPYMTGLHFVWGLGGLLSPLIVVQLYRVTGGLTASFAVIALIIAACGLLYVRLPSPPPLVQDSETGEPLALRPLLTLMAMFFLAGVMELSLAAFVFTFVYEGGWGNEQQAGWVTSSFYGALTATRLLIAFLALRLSSHAVLGYALVLVLSSCTVALLAPQSLTLIWICVAVNGVGQAAMFPLTLAAAPQYLPAEGRVTSFMFGGASVGFVCMPWLVGRMFESEFLGPDVVWFAPAAAALAFALLLIVLKMTPTHASYTAPTPQPAAGS